MFDQLRIPTPFEVGTVNTYLAGGTLVDPGPDSDDAWSALVATLEDHGLEPADVHRVLVTHPHPDHFGLAKRLADEGATVSAIDEAVGILEDFPGRLAYEQAYFGPFLCRHGITQDVADSALKLPEAYLEFAPSCPVDRPLADGDTIDVAGEQLTVEAVTGHATGEAVFTWQDSSSEHAIVGDHVHETITPNPFLQPPPHPDEPRPRMLPAYNQSLEHLAARDFSTLLPGHGGVIDRPTHRIERLLAFHERRSEKVLAAVDGRVTAAAVMRDLFGDVPVTEVYGGMSEAVGHLDLLELRGHVERTKVDGVWHYHRAGQ